MDSPNLKKLSIYNSMTSIVYSVKSSSHLLDTKVNDAMGVVAVGAL